ncbi:MAG: [protein-PII] uridylyltransferase [Nitrospirae bacterium]|nr:[protein-PII] uridylyltransferase [Nitrospirota bacterium]
MGFLGDIEDIFHKLSGRELAAFYTQKIDDFLIKAFDSVESQRPLALIAIGGYGRSELAPYSDIDIMFFARDKTDSEKVKSVLYKLWDKGLTIGHCFRTADDCLTEAGKDLRTHTSLLESRFVAGDEGLYNYFKERVYSEIAYRKQKGFISGKLKEMEKRHRDYGDSVFLLEPNVKEGQGGLRDIHNVLWLSKVALKFGGINDLSSLIPQHEFKRLMKAYDFLLKVRFALHLMSNRRNDVISFNTHDYVAERLGFHDSKKFSGPERFMRYFYLKASIVQDITAIVVGICSRQWPAAGRRTWGPKKRVTDHFYIYKNVIIPSGKDIFRGTPDRIIEAFYVYSKTGKGFSPGLREDIRRNLILIGKKVRSSQRAISFFYEILRGMRVYETLKEMHETGVLGRFIPEFGALRSLVVYDPYHRYTVDEHTLLAVKHLELLTVTRYKKLERLSEIMRSVKEKEILFLSLLFHDIGKAAGNPRTEIMRGKYHEEEGYKRLKNIVERFNMAVEQRLRIEFLVWNHILMSALALKRETEDPDIIAQFAEAAGDEEGLKSLYLMTYADMSAVNPAFWTEWKAYLLGDLYERTLNYLRGTRENIEIYMKNILSSYTGTDKKGLGAFLDEMPERYLLSTPVERIYEDYKLACSVMDNNFSVSINEKPDSTTEITIGAWDKPGLFSRIVGFLSSKWMNILRARLYTGKKGLVIDKIQISNWKELWWDGMPGVIEDGLRSVVLEDGRFSLTGTRKETCARFEAFIELDNETSEENTIVEFFSADRHGLLYDVSNVFYETGFNIISAKINTGSDVAHDIFYIQHEGGKVNGVKTTEVLVSLWEILKV